MIKALFFFNPNSNSNIPIKSNQSLKQNTYQLVLLQQSVLLLTIAIIIRNINIQIVRVQASSLQLHLLLLVGPTIFVSVVHVLTVGSRMREAFATFSAFEWLLARVKSLMLGQMVFVLESFGANIAYKRPDSRMFVFVSGKRGLFAKHFVALIACVHVTAFYDVVFPRFATASLRRRGWAIVQTFKQTEET
jgi:hypothetical protein